MAQLIAKLRKELAQAGDPKRAPQMQAYMKSEMPYHGVSSPLAKQIFRRVLTPLEFGNAAEWKRAVCELWDKAKYREERYGALHLCKTRNARPFQTPSALPLYEKLIVSGAWWDFVDDIASHSVSDLVKGHPTKLKPVMRRWAKDRNLWKRRTSILCQLPFRAQTDLDLLYACIEPSLGSKEFFLNKAIGWALRQVAWTNLKEVQRYIKQNEDRLSPLSKREALKNAHKLE